MSFRSGIVILFGLLNVCSMGRAVTLGIVADIVSYVVYFLFFCGLLVYGRVPCTCIVEKGGMMCMLLLVTYMGSELELMRGTLHSSFCCSSLAMSSIWTCWGFLVK